MLPNVAENREIRNDLFYNIATAQEKAYDIDRNAAHLRSARALLVDFVDEYKRLYQPTDEAKAEVARVKERIASLDARIAEAEKQPPPTGTVNAAKQQRDAGVRQVFAADPELGRQYKSGRSMIIGGSVALGIGGLSLLIAAAGIAEARDNDGDQEFDRNVAIGFGVVGIAAVVAGAVLLGIGVPKRKHALATARSRVVFAPTFGPSGQGRQMVGFSLGGRF
jgi:hypothetical protein